MHDNSDGGTDTKPLTRRRFGALAGAGLTAALAGCSGSEDSSGGSNDSSGEQANTGEQTSTASPTATAGETTDQPTDESTSASTSTSTSADTTTASSSSSGDEQIESVSDTLEVLEHELFEEEFTAGVRGEIENVSDETLSYVGVQAYFQDEGGTRIGDSLDNTTDLPAGEVWAFEAPYVGSEDAEAIEDYTLAVSDSPLD